MDKVVLICATGRSGSTTLQRIINTIPNTNICGENMGAVNSILECYRRLKITTRDYVPGHLKPVSYEEIINAGVKPSWYNSYNLDDITRMIKLLIIKLFKKTDNTNLWGFKEIRYDGLNGNHIEYMSEFLELFPQTKIIIQVRENIIQQSKSDWLAKDSSSLTYLKKYNKRMFDFYKQHRTFCFLTSFEKMFDMKNMREIFRFIDCEEDFSEERVKRVLDNNLKD
jgi:hypothetical protein